MSHRQRSASPHRPNLPKGRDAPSLRVKATATPTPPLRGGEADAAIQNAATLTPVLLDRHGLRPQDDNDPSSPGATSITLDEQLAVAGPAACLPVDDAVAQRVVSLPMHPYLDAAAQQRIAEVVAEFSASNLAPALV